MTKAATYHNPFTGPAGTKRNETLPQRFLPATKYKEMPGVPVTVYKATLTLSHWQRRRELTQEGSRS